MCAPNPALASELARARQRDKLQAQIDKAAGELTKTTTPKTANSDAKALASYLSALGYDADADRINRLLVLLSVLIVECGAGLSLTVALSLSSPPASATAAPASEPDTQAQTPKTTLANAANDAANASVQASRTQRLERPASVRASDLEEWLRLQGGKAHVGMRGLGVALGCSPSKAHDQVRRLSASGVVRAMPGSRGTTLELVAARVN